MASKKVNVAEAVADLRKRADAAIERVRQSETVQELIDECENLASDIQDIQNDLEYTQSY